MCRTASGKNKTAAEISFNAMEAKEKQKELKTKKD